MSKKFNFSETDKTRIKEAVKKVEEKTSGEIVPYIVKKSDNYNEAPFIASLIIAVISIVVVNILSQLWLLPLKFDLLLYSLIFIGIILITFVPVLLCPFLKRTVVSDKKEMKMVNKRASEAFIAEEVFNTKDRTGILIFISQLEHKVEILADSGINQKVKPEEWSGIVKTIITGIKKKNTAEAIANAIEQCGELLVNAGFTITKDDTNELSDDLRIKDE